MNRRIILILLSIGVLVFAVYCLFIQPELLGESISRKLNLPLGSLISWLGIIACTILLHLFIKLPTKSVLSKVNKLLRYFHLGLALFWLPVSFLMSGNLAFTFQNKPIAFKLWIGYTVVVLLFPLLFIVLNRFGKYEK